MYPLNTLDVSFEIRIIFRSSIGDGDDNTKMLTTESISIVVKLERLINHEHLIFGLLKLLKQIKSIS